MDDVVRIDQMLEILRRAWIRHPDYRLGQLIVNAVRPNQPCPEVFFIRDTVLARRLERLAEASPDANE